MKICIQIGQNILAIFLSFCLVLAVPAQPAQAAYSCPDLFRDDSLLAQASATLGSFLRRSPERRSSPAVTSEDHHQPMEAERWKTIAAGTGMGTLLGVGAMGIPLNEAAGSAFLVSMGLVYAQPSIEMVIDQAKTIVPKEFQSFFIAVVSNLSGFGLVALQGLTGTNFENAASITLGSAALMPMVTCLAILTAIRIRQIREAKKELGTDTDLRVAPKLSLAQQAKVFGLSFGETIKAASDLANSHEQRMQLARQVKTQGGILSQTLAAFIGDARRFAAPIVNRDDVRANFIMSSVFSAMGLLFLFGLKPMIEAHHAGADALVGVWLTVSLGFTGAYLSRILSSEERRFVSALDSITTDKVYEYGQQLAASRQVRPDLADMLKEKLSDLGEWKRIEEAKEDERDQLQAEYVQRAEKILKFIRLSQNLTEGLKGIFRQEDDMQAAPASPAKQGMLTKIRQQTRALFAKASLVPGLALGLIGVFGSTLAMHLGLSVVSLRLGPENEMAAVVGLGLLLSLGEFHGIKSLILRGQIRGATDIGTESGAINIAFSALAVGLIFTLTRFFG